MLILATGTAWAFQATISNKHKPIDISSVSKQFPSIADLYTLIIHPKPSDNAFFPTVIESNHKEPTLTKCYMCQYSAFFYL